MATKELTVAQWQDEIDNGLKFRKEYGIEDQWAELEALFYNVTDEQRTPGPNIIFSTGDSLLSQLTSPNPHILIKPLRQEAVNTAPILEQLDNTLLNSLNMADEVENAV